MSTARLHKKLNINTEYTSELPEEVALDQSITRFLAKLNTLRKDYSETKNEFVLLNEFASLEIEYEKLSKNILALGMEKLNKKMQEFLNELPNVSVLQSQLKELAKYANTFKKTNNAQNPVEQKQEKNSQEQFIEQVDSELNIRHSM